MLIKALCDYYDILSLNGKVLPEGYSNVKIHYLICLTPEGTMGEVINYQRKEEIKIGNKVKERWVPRELVLPQRTEKPGIDSNFVEHRPLYIFGLNPDNERFTPVDATNKAKKSHQAFVDTNKVFIDGLHSPIIDAYRLFLERWSPEDETGNRFLLELGKDYGKSSFAFCLMGSPDILLHEDPQLKSRWEKMCGTLHEEENVHTAQCGIIGEEESIARIHNKIKGIYGGLATGCVLVGFKNPAEQSYGNEQSYNSNISEKVMKKYTETLNFLLSGTRHKIVLDDMTILFWAMATDGSYEDAFLSLLSGDSEQMNAEQTEQMLKNMLDRGKKGEILVDQIDSVASIKENVDFYIVGLKPNSSRLSLKFVYRRKYADILWNIARFQQDMQVTEELKPVPLYRIKKELLSPKSKSETVNPELMSKLMESIIYGRPYPIALLETVVRRVKTDGGDYKINGTRIGIIKACLNRSYEKEEFNVGLDRENYGQAYLCGRLFAVLEKLQQDVSGASLNRTIKDVYFASAASTPAIIFPKLLKLAQNHLSKLKSPVFYNILIQEIIGNLKGEFPDILPLKKQGEFMIGYYQQQQDFFKKKDQIKAQSTKEENDYVTE